MFYVIEKDTGKIRMVYGINGLYFIMWDKTTECWVTDHISKYEPLES